MLILEVNQVNQIRESLAIMGDNSTAFSLPQVCVCPIYSLLISFIIYSVQLKFQVFFILNSTNWSLDVSLLLFAFEMTYLVGFYIRVHIFSSKQSP